jgi:hypothetical protein
MKILRNEEITSARVNASESSSPAPVSPTVGFGASSFRFRIVTGCVHLHTRSNYICNTFHDRIQPATRFLLNIVAHTWPLCENCNSSFRSLCTLFLFPTLRISLNQRVAECLCDTTIEKPTNIAYSGRVQIPTKSLPILSLEFSFI